MKIKREIDCTKATYDLTGLTHEEFMRIYKSVEHYSMYTQRHYDDAFTTKLREMANSNVTIVRTDEALQDNK